MFVLSLVSAASVLAPPACSERCEAGAACQLASGDTRADAGPNLVQPGAECAQKTVRATRGRAKPVDVVFVIDNSGSMVEEIAAVQENINRDFAAIIAESGVDYRVILLSLYGVGGTSICISPPLAGSACEAGVAATASETFHHYSVEIGSQDAFCQILTTFDRPDQFGLAPEGWQAWLRPDAQKALVVITDDSAFCAYASGETQLEFGRDSDPYVDALAFHKALLARSPEQFGVPPDVRYQFYSIVGLAPNALVTEPYFPYQALNSTTCDTAPAPGLSYQALSVATDALRYPVCDGRSFDAVFRVLASSVIQSSKQDCLFELPDAPEWSVIDLDSVHLEYRAGDGAMPRRFDQVRPGACKDDHSFVIRERIELCPAACRLVQADAAPEINIRFGCTAIPQ
jgi:hypothetical protein